MSFQPFVPFDGSTKVWYDRRKETSQSSPFLPSLFLRSFPPPSHQPSSPPTTYLSDQVHPDAVLRMQARQQTPGTAGRQAFAARTRAQEDGFVEGRESDAWTGDCVGTRRESWGHLHQPKADFFLPVSFAADSSRFGGSSNFLPPSSFALSLPTLELNAPLPPPRLLPEYH